MSDYVLQSTWEEVDAAAQAVANGIQASQLAASVQTSLGKAGTALQPTTGLTIANQASKTPSMTTPIGVDSSGKLWADTLMTDAAREALLDLLAYAAYTGPNAQQKYNALVNALAAKLDSITAVFTQGSTAVYDKDDLEYLRSMLVVTANYDNGVTATVTSYTLSGTLTAGTSEITVSYGGKTTSFNVNVSGVSLPSGYTRYDYIAMKAANNTQRAKATWITLNTLQNLDALSVDCYFSVKTLNSSLYGKYIWGVRKESDYLTSFALYMDTGNAGKEIAFVCHNKYLMPYSAINKTHKNKLRFINPATSPCTVQFNNGEMQNETWTTENTGNNNAISLFQNAASSATTGYVNGDAMIGDIILHDRSGNLVAYYVPCVYNGQIGMYDGVTQQFYSSSTASYTTISNSNCLYEVGNWS